MFVEERDKLVNSLKKLNSDIKGGYIPGKEDYYDIILPAIHFVDQYGMFEEEVIATIDRALEE